MLLKSKSSLEILFVILLFLMMCESTPVVEKNIPNKKLKRGDVWADITVPSESTFGNNENSPIYVSVLSNKWITSSIKSPKIVNRIDYFSFFDIEVDGEYLYVSDLVHGLWIFSIIDINRPVLLSQVYLERARGIVVHGNRVYVACERLGVAAIDIEDKENAKLLKYFPKPPGYLMFNFPQTYAGRALYIRNDVMYVLYKDFNSPANGGMIFPYNISNINEEWFLGYWSENLGNMNDLYAVGDPGYMIVTFDNRLRFHQMLSDGKLTGSPSSTNYNDWDHVECIRGRGNIGYLTFREGFKIIDITSKTGDRPTLGNYLITSGSGQNDERRMSLPEGSDIAYVVGNGDGIYMINVTNVTHPNLVGFIDINNFSLGNSAEISTGSMTDITFDDKYLYTVNKLSTTGVDFKIYDLPKNNDPPKLVSKVYDTSSNQRIFIFGNFSYLYSDGTVKMYNVYNRSKPIYTETLSGVSYPRSIKVNEYSETFGGFTRDLRIVYTADSDEIGAWDCSETCMEDFHGTLSTSDSTSVDIIRDSINGTKWIFATDSNQIIVIEAGNFESLTTVGTVGGFSSAQWIELDESDNYAYVADYDDGMKIVNVTNRKNPTILSECNTLYCDIVHVSVSGNYAFVRETREAMPPSFDYYTIRVIDVRDKTDPKTVTEIDLESLGIFHVEAFVVKDNYLYIADGVAGMKVVRFDIGISVTDDFNDFCGDMTVFVEGEDETGSTSASFGIHREDYCYGRGTCLPNYQCLCSDGYEGDNCETWSCGGYDFKNIEKTCNGNGDCLSPETCSCNGGYGGDSCKTNLLLTTVMVPILTVGAFGFGICLIIICYTVCVVCCAGFLGLICVLCGTCCVVMRQFFGLKRFQKLKDFDLLLKEQELDEDTSIAHLRINKSLFEIDYEEIILRKVLGEGGSNSVVYKVEWNGKIAAFKSFKTRDICTNQDTFDEFEKEVEVLGSVSHPNILQFYGCVMKPPRVGILMEFCENGDLSFFLQRYTSENEMSLEFKEKLRILFEIIHPMAYLHARNIIHRDLKLENVLVDGRRQCKLMDFGLSRIVENMNRLKTKSIGTSIYMSPELLHGDYNQKVDVFAFGVCAYIIFTELYRPYGNNDENIEMRVANDPNLRPDVSKVGGCVPSGHVKWIVDLMKSSWHHDPVSRPEFKDLAGMVQEGQASLDEGRDYGGKSGEDKNKSNSIPPWLVVSETIVEEEEEKKDENAQNDEMRLLLDEVERLKKENEDLRIRLGEKNGEEGGKMITEENVDEMSFDDF